MTSTINLAETTQAVYDGFIAGNLEPIFALVGETSTWKYHADSHSPFTGVYTGMEELQGFFGKLALIDMEKFEVQSIMQNGETFVILIDVKQTIKATSEVREGQEVHVLTYEGDKVKEMNIYFPSATYA